MATRRAFLAALLAATGAPALGWADAGGPAFLACARAPDGGFALHGLTAAGASAFAIPLPARGHAGCGHPVLARAVVFARRPGAFALVIDCARGAVLRRLAPPEGRQLNGHGAFLAGGAVLATSEQVAETSEGVVGLWDAEAGFRRIGEVTSGGIGPHDLRLLPGGQVAVANGGIATDPADRTKLNIASMRPNLALLDPLGDGVAEVVELDPALARASIRHLAAAPDGRLAFAMQWEGDPGEIVPLAGLRTPDGRVALAEAPDAEARLMGGYAGSVALSGNGTAFAITSPRGGRVQRFDASTGAFLDAFARVEVCGAAPLADGLVLSDGLGGLVALDPGPRPLGRFDMAWDNHLVAL